MLLAQLTEDESGTDKGIGEHAVHRVPAAKARSPASKRSTSTAKIHWQTESPGCRRQRIAFRLVETSDASDKIATSPNNPVNRPKLFSLPHEFETVGENFFEAIVFPPRLAAKNDPGGR